MLCFAMAAGNLLGSMLIAVIPAYFKAKFGVNETLFTLMLNYVMQYYVLMLRTQTWKDPKAMGFPKIAAVPNNAILPKVFGIHIGWIIAIILVVLVSMLLRRTKIGYEIRVVGASVNTARYAGMDVEQSYFWHLYVGCYRWIDGHGPTPATYNLSVVGGGSGFTAVIIGSIKHRRWASDRWLPVGALTGAVGMGLLRYSGRTG